MGVHGVGGCCGSNGKSWSWQSWCYGGVYVVVMVYAMGHGMFLYRWCFDDGVYVLVVSLVRSSGNHKRSMTCHVFFIRAEERNL